MNRILHLYLTVPLLALWIMSTSVIDLNAQSLPGDTELGIIAGEPTGISAKFWTGGNNAVDLGVAWSLYRSGSLHVHADYLWHHQLDPDAQELLYYYGLGGRMLIGDDLKAGIRIPLGLQFMIPDSRLSLFFEIAPIFNLVPATDFDVNGGLGIRFFL